VRERRKEHKRKIIVDFTKAAAGKNRYNKAMVLNPLDCINMSTLEIFGKEVTLKN
jgi:hypothetical protein